MGRDDSRTVTLRRLLQQTKHCVEEALSVVENSEDERCALDDLKQAEMLIEKCIEDVKSLHRFRTG